MFSWARNNNNNNNTTPWPSPPPPISFPIFLYTKKPHTPHPNIYWPPNLHLKKYKKTIPHFFFSRLHHHLLSNRLQESAPVAIFTNTNVNTFDNVYFVSIDADDGPVAEWKKRGGLFLL